MKHQRWKATGFAFAIGLTFLSRAAQGGQESASEGSASVNHVLEWNRILVESLIATNAVNSSSPRLGAIVHTAIERRYSPIFVHRRAPGGAARRAAVVSAAYTSLGDLFPSQKDALDVRYAASLAALSAACEDSRQTSDSRRSCTMGIERGVEWGFDVASIVLGWRATDGFSLSYSPFAGGSEIGQWRPTPPALGPMSAQGLAFTDAFVLNSRTQFQPGPPRGLTDPTYTADFNAVKALGRRTGSTRTDNQTALAAKATPASIGIRQRISLRVSTTCPFPIPTGFSQY